MKYRYKWQPTPVFLPGKFQRQMILAGYRRGCKESDVTEYIQTYTCTHTHTHTHTHITTASKYSEDAKLFQNEIEYFFKMSFL